MWSLLPHGTGVLPKWLLFTSCLGLFNTIQNFLTLSLTRRVYAKSPLQVTPLQSRTFGVWTLTSSMVRAYCAYNISDRTIYQMALWTYTFVLIHYAIIGGASLVWMLQQYNFYT